MGHNLSDLLETVLMCLQYDACVFFGTFNNPALHVAAEYLAAAVYPGQSIYISIISTIFHVYNTKY